MDRAWFYQPVEAFDWARWLRYFDLPDSTSARRWIREAVYQGEPLTDLFESIGIELADDAHTGLVHLHLRRAEGSPLCEDVDYRYLNFRQLVPESNWQPGPSTPSDWTQIDTQTRLEICQHELGRWSVFLKLRGWRPENLDAKGDEPFESIEIVNNCTTSDGFEFKVRHAGKLYHGSFSMPQEPYRALCRAQAGAWPRQGFWGQEPPEGDEEAAECGLIEPTKSNLRFGEIYRAENFHASKEITIDLDRYREISHSLCQGAIELNLGRIPYHRWGASTEYHDKPWNRHLVMDPEATTENPKSFIAPPRTYEEIQSQNPFCRLPNFWPDGTYRLTQPQEKEHFHLLSSVNEFEIFSTATNLYEIVLSRDASKSLELQHIVLGNIDLSRVPVFPEYSTFDRFALAPRPTLSRYDANWRPASLTHPGRTPFGFLLGKIGGRPRSGSPAPFIQPESWGLERAILSFEDASREILVIDLISFERILPLWQGKIDLSAANLESPSLWPPQET